MKYLWKRLKEVPKYGWICGFAYFGLQYFMYRLANWISIWLKTTNWAFAPKIPCIDNSIPVIPVFVVIYLFSYLFWIFGPIACSLTEKKNFVNYLIGLSAAYLIGFLIFIFAPTYMDRTAEGLTGYAGRNGLFDKLLSVVYSADGEQLGFNLFPSYHCLISVYCYLGIRKREEISRGFRVYSLIMAVLICMSTVFTKQHYFIDIPGGVLISIVCYAVVRKLDPAKRFVK